MLEVEIREILAGQHDRLVSAKPGVFFRERGRHTMARDDPPVCGDRGADGSGQIRKFRTKGPLRCQRVAVGPNLMSGPAVNQADTDLDLPGFLFHTALEQKIQGFPPHDLQSLLDTPLAHRAGKRSRRMNEILILGDHENFRNQGPGQLRSVYRCKRRFEPGDSQHRAPQQGCRGGVRNEEGQSVSSLLHDDGAPGSRFAEITEYFPQAPRVGADQAVGRGVELLANAVAVEGDAVL